MSIKNKFNIVRIVFFATSMLFFGSLKAQNIDSLLNVLSTQIPDTSKVRNYLQLGKAFNSNDLDSALYYYNQALELAGSISDAFPFFKGLVLENIGVAYYGRGDRALIISYLKKAMQSHENANLHEEVSRTEHRLATYYSNFSMFDSAVYHFDQVIARNKKHNLNIEMVNSLSSSGLNSYYLRDLDKAAKSLLEAIRYGNETGDTSRIYAPYLNYGLVLKEQKQYEQAKKYMNAALDKLMDINAERGLAITLTNIGQVLVLQDSLDAAFEAFTRSMVYQEKLGWSGSTYYNEIAWIEKKRGNYMKYHEYAEEAVNRIGSTTAPKTIADHNANLVEAKLLLADCVFVDFSSERRRLWNEALPLARKGWELANEVNSGNVKLRTANALALVLANLGKYEEAFELSQISRELSDQINDQARSDAIARMTTEFQTEQLETENALLQKTQQVQLVKLRQQRYLLIGSLIVLILIITITLIILRNRVRLAKASQQIKKSLEEKELLLKEIHHRVKNNLQVVSSLLDLQSREVDDEKTLNTFMEGQNRVKAMSLIHQKMYQNNHLASIDFAEYAENLMKELSTIYDSSKGVKTTVVAIDPIMLDIDTAIPLGLILNELTSNAYKYAFGVSESGELKVEFHALSEGRHKMIVSDTGEGLPEDFEFDKAKSLGLRLVRRLAKQLYGTVEYKSQNGAQFIINFKEALRSRKV